MAVTWCSVLRVVILLLLSGVIAIAFFTLPFEKILKAFLVWIDTNLGRWGPLVLALAYIPLTVLAVPASILTIGGGYLFGLPLGFVADSMGSTAGATAAFLLGKMVGRSYVVSKLKNYPKFEAVAIAIQRSGFKITLLLRLAPLLPFNILNYLLLNSYQYWRIHIGFLVGYGAHHFCSRVRWNYYQGPLLCHPWMEGRFLGSLDITHCRICINCGSDDFGRSSSKEGIK